MSTVARANAPTPLPARQDASVLPPRYQREDPAFLKEPHAASQRWALLLEIEALRAHLQWRAGAELQSAHTTLTRLLERMDEVIERDLRPGRLLVNDLVERALPHLEAILRNPRQVLRRHREDRPLHQATIMDAACLRWYARQPGITPIEKAGLRQRLRTVVRRPSLDVVENQVVRYVLDQLSVLLGFWKQWRVDRIEADENRELKTLEGIHREWCAHPALRDVPARVPALPTNTLMRDPHYGPIWTIARVLTARDQRYEALWRDIDEGLLDLVGLTALSALRAAGARIIEDALVVTANEHGPVGPLSARRIPQARGTSAAWVLFRGDDAPTPVGVLPRLEHPHETMTSGRIHCVLYNTASGDPFAAIPPFPIHATGCDLHELIRHVRERLHIELTRALVPFVQPPAPPARRELHSQAAGIDPSPWGWGIAETGRGSDTEDHVHLEPPELLEVSTRGQTEAPHDTDPPPEDQRRTLLVPGSERFDGKHGFLSQWVELLDSAASDASTVARKLLQLPPAIRPRYRDRAWVVPDTADPRMHSAMVKAARDAAPGRAWLLPRSVAAMLCAERHASAVVHTQWAVLSTGGPHATLSRVDTSTEEEDTLIVRHRRHGALRWHVGMLLDEIVRVHELLPDHPRNRLWLLESLHHAWPNRTRIPTLPACASEGPVTARLDEAKVGEATRRSLSILADELAGVDWPAEELSLHVEGWLPAHPMLRPHFTATLQGSWQSLRTDEQYAAAARGAALFIERHAAGRPTWREQLPGVELESARDGRRDWLTVIEPDTRVYPGQQLRKQSPVKLIIRPAGQGQRAQVRLGIRLDGEELPYSAVWKSQFALLSAESVRLFATWQTGEEGLSIELEPDGPNSRLRKVRFSWSELVGAAEEGVRNIVPPRPSPRALSSNEVGEHRKRLDAIYACAGSANATGLDELVQALVDTLPKPPALLEPQDEEAKIAWKDFTESTNQLVTLVLGARLSKKEKRALQQYRKHLDALKASRGWPRLVEVSLWHHRNREIEEQIEIKVSNALKQQQRRDRGKPAKDTPDLDLCIRQFGCVLRHTIASDHAPERVRYLIDLLGCCAERDDLRRAWASALMFAFIGHESPDAMALDAQLVHELKEAVLQFGNKLHATQSLSAAWEDLAAACFGLLRLRMGQEDLCGPTSDWSTSLLEHVRVWLDAMPEEVRNRRRNLKIGDDQTLWTGLIGVLEGRREIVLEQVD